VIKKCLLVICNRGTLAVWSVTGFFSCFSISGYFLKN
jgi:hypothetical protein